MAHVEGMRQPRDTVERLAAGVALAAVVAFVTAREVQTHQGRDEQPDQPRVFLTTGELRRSVGKENLDEMGEACGFQADKGGSRAWFELMPEKEAPPLGEVRVLHGGPEIGYDLFEQTVGSKLRGEYSVPGLADCQVFGLPKGKVWVFRGIQPENRFTPAQP